MERNLYERLGEPSFSGPAEPDRNGEMSKQRSSLCLPSKR